MRTLIILSMIALYPVASGMGQTSNDSAAVVDSARAALARLCSPEFAGRGYLRDGHVKAATYIRDAMTVIGLRDVTMQDFDMDVRVFPKTPSLSVDGKALIPGIEFLPDAKCPSGRVDSPQSPSSLGVRIVPVERLTHDLERDSTAHPVFQVLKSVVSDTTAPISFNVVSRRIHVTGYNVYGEVPGTSAPDSIIVVCAHYDHLGMLGDSLYFPGANDNGSGTAMLLALAQHIRKHPLKYTTVFIAFGGEEAGLIGSQHFIAHPPFGLKRVRFVLNADMCASGREGIMACGGSDHPKEFALLQSVNDALNLGELRKRANAPNSDQYVFEIMGIGSFYVYPFTGYQPYHHINDKPETLQWDVFWKMYRLFRGFVIKIGQ